MHVPPIPCSVGSTPVNIEATEGTEATSAQRGTPGADPCDLEQVRRAWPAVIDQVRQSGSAMLSALFEGARPVAVDAEMGVLQIGFPAGSTFNKRKAEATEHRERITEALRAVIGERLRPVYVLLDEQDGGSEPIDEEELLARIKAEFDAEEVVAGEETGRVSEGNG